MDIYTRRETCAPQSGLTLVELVSTLAIASIVLFTGIPEFHRLLAGNRMTADINTLVTHLYLARSEAVKRGRRAVLCPSSDGTQCLPDSRWEQGYLVFVDSNANRERENSEPLLRVHRSAGFGTRITSTTGRRRVTYHPDGSATGSNLTLTFCAADEKVPPKAVIVSNTGRHRLSDTRADGSPIDCG